MELSNFKPVPKGPGGLERIYLDHKTGKLLSSEGTKSENLDLITVKDALRVYNFIPIGLVRQRQMWPERGSAEALAKKGKQCISTDGDTGIPQPSFPWQDHYADPPGIDGDKFLPCSMCPFAKWGDGKSPRCQPRWYVPAFPDFALNGNKMDTDILDREPFVLDFTQSGITQIKKYLQNQVPDKTSIWGNAISMHVDLNVKGDRTYASPLLQHTVPTEPDYHTFFIAHARKVREKLEKAAIPSKTARPAIVGLKPRA